MPVEDSTGKAVVSPAASTLRDEMAVGGQRLLAARGQIPMAAHIGGPAQLWAVDELPRPDVFPPSSHVHGTTWLLQAPTWCRVGRMLPDVGVAARSGRRGREFKSPQPDW